MTVPTLRRTVAAGVLGASCAMFLVAGPPAQALDIAPTTLGEVTLVDLGPAMVGGYTDLQLDVELSDPDGLPDVLQNFETEPFPVGFAQVDRSGVVVPVPTDSLVDEVWWDSLSRISGTPTDGVWRGTARVSWVSTGTVHVTQVIVTDVTSDVTVLPVEDGPSVEVGSPSSVPWMYQVLNPPVRVVTGSERWQPSLRLATRSGTAVAGARTAYTPPGINDVPFWAYDAAYYAPDNPIPSLLYTAATNGTGGVVLPSYRVYEVQYVSSLAGWRSGSNRYHTVGAVGILSPPVKWQARAFFATDGGAIVMTGNAFPAPTLFDAANDRVHLQRLIGRTWRTEATATVRDNGRYTVVWDAPPADGYWVRMYKPGGVEEFRTSAGTVGPAVWVPTA